MVEYNRLYREHQSLILKKFKMGLTPNEARRVQEIRNALDEIKLQAFGKSPIGLMETLQLLEEDSNTPVVRTKSYSLEELLAGITENNLYEEC